MSDSIVLKPIGYVSSDIKEKRDYGWGPVVARITLMPEYRGSLSGLESFSHVLILSYLHQAQFDAAKHLRRRPQGRVDMPVVGIFAQRAKNRPNPIGLTAVEIINVAEDYIDIKGLDRIASPLVPDWVNELMKEYF